MAIYSGFNPSKMVIFHSYVKLPEGIQIYGASRAQERTRWQRQISVVVDSLMAELCAPSTTAAGADWDWRIPLGRGAIVVQQIAGWSWMVAINERHSRHWPPWSGSLGLMFGPVRLFQTTSNYYILTHQIAFLFSDSVTLILRSVQDAQVRYEHLRSLLESLRKDLNFGEVVEWSTIRASGGFFFHPGIYPLVN